MINEDRRCVHSSGPSEPALAEIACHGFKVPRARSESFPNAAEIGRGIKFLTVNCGQQGALRRWLIGRSEDGTYCKIVVIWRPSAFDLVGRNT